MEKKVTLEITDNRPLTDAVWEMTLRGDLSGIERAGQFVNLALEGHYLRRPISICDWEGDTLTLVYKVVGEGTEQMSRMRAGERIDTLTGLGNGFNAGHRCCRPLLVGGGVGVPPLYHLAKELIANGKEVTVILGFNAASEIFYHEKFEALGAAVIVATADGSAGIKGFVTDAIRESGVEFDYIYSCGPIPMLKALCAATDADGELSFEERMGCGFGVCMGCTCHTADGGHKRICKEGPVLKRSEIVW